jgi:glucose-1-phosphatase
VGSIQNTVHCNMEDILAIKAIIWDLGGVIVRTEDSAPRETLAAELSVSRADLEESVFGGDAGAKAQRGEISSQALWEYNREKFGLSPEGLLDFRKRFFGGDVVDYELVDYIRSLKRDYTTALLSNAFADLRHLVVQRWKIADAFDALTISAEEGVMKPDARVYQIALERSGIEASQAVFIDDFQHNIEGAKAVGMQAILFKSPQQVKSDLKAMLA